MLNRIKHIKEYLYRQSYYYVCCPTHKEFRKIVKKEINLELSEKVLTEGGFYIIDVDGVDVHLIWTKDKSPELIAHELMHSISYGLRKKGMPLGDDSEEAYCYLIQYLMREFLKDNGEKKRKKKSSGLQKKSVKE